MSRVIEKELTRRSGSEESDVTTSGGELWTDPWNSSPYKFADYELVESRLRSRFVGWDIPDFHRRMKMGELLPHTPWKSFRSEGYSNGVYDFRTNVGGGINRWWATENYPNIMQWRIIEEDLQPYFPDDYGSYVQEAAARIYSSGHDTLTFLAELVDVRRLFLNAAKTLLKLRIPRNWKQLSNEWLAGRYGWRTLLYDIEDLNKAVARLGEKRRSRFSQKAGYHNDTTVMNVSTLEKTHYYQELTTVDKVRVSIRGSVTADAWIPEFQFNPLVTAWEKIPLSFVVDWFLGIGKSLAATSFMTLQSKYAASMGFRVDMTRTFSAEISEGKSTFYDGSHSQDGYSEASYELRTPCNVPLTPQWKLKLNPYKILDLLGLVVQRL